MINVTDTEIAKMIGVARNTIVVAKRENKERYEIYKLGAYAKKLGLDVVKMQYMKAKFLEN